MSYRTLLYVVLSLSVLSVAGMSEIRTSLIVAIGIINLAIWVWPRIEKILKERRAQTDLGEKHLQVGNYKEAEEALEKAIVEAEFRKSSASKRAALFVSLGESQRRQGKLDEAERSIRQAMALAPGQGGEQRAQFLDRLASVEEDRGNHPQAQQLLRESITTEEGLRRPNWQTVARRCQRLAMAYHRARDFAGAAPHFARSIELHQTAFGREHEETGRALADLGTALATEGDHARAVERLREALSIEERALGHDSPAVAEDLFHLAMSYEKLGNLDEAVEQLERLATLLERLVGGNESEVGIVFFHLSRLHLELGRLGRAEETAMTAVPLLERTTRPELGSALETLAEIYTRGGQSAQAVEMRERARLTWNNLGMTPPPKRSREASV
jgi:tetratricopeptide (TPR) repeat protein